MILHNGFFEKKTQKPNLRHIWKCVSLKKQEKLKPKIEIGRVIKNKCHYIKFHGEESDFSRILICLRLAIKKNKELN